MPTYDYFCELNARKVEVSHRMNEVIHNWGELCARAHLEPGDTPAETPVRKLISGGSIISSASLTNPEPPCASGSCCPGGSCGLG